MIIKTIFKGSFAQSIVEIILIVIGVLIALWVDEWRSDLVERKAIQLHLAGIVGEVDSNRWTLHRIRDGSVSRQIAALEYVIHILDQPDPEIEDPERFIETLIASAKIRSHGSNGTALIRSGLRSIITRLIFRVLHRLFPTPTRHRPSCMVSASIIEMPTRILSVSLCQPDIKARTMKCAATRLPDFRRP